MDKVIVYSIKKAGTHLVSDIISLLVNIDTDISNKTEMYKVIPHCTSRKIYDNSKQPIISTHPAYIKMKSDLINSNKNGIIFVIRNPLDLCISQYYFYEKRKKKQNQVDIFTFCKNNYKEQVRLVKRHINKQSKIKNSILISFEDIVNNKGDSIQKIYHFLIKNNKLEGINLNCDLINSIINKTEFKTVQNSEIKNGKYKVGNKQPELFHRNGSVDQWKQHFTLDQYNEIIGVSSKSTQTSQSVLQQNVLQRRNTW